MEGEGVGEVVVVGGAAEHSPPDAREPIRFLMCARDDFVALSTARYISLP